MRYSESLDAVFCAPCVLFGSQRPDVKDKTFGLSSPVSDWINLSRCVSRHIQEGSKHYEHVMSADEYVRIQTGKSSDIWQSLSKSYNELVLRNRKILQSIIEVIILCGKQNIALRGHEEKDSNFVALLHDKAKSNELLADHLAYCDPRAKYTSPEIQNELIQLCADQIQNDIVARCNGAMYFGFIADEATDSSTKEQISLCVRYFEKQSKTVHEDFLGFAEADKTTGEALANKFIAELESTGIVVANMRGQGYDGAANMSGIHRGVQARVRETVPDAAYVHCKAHNLNLAIVHACKLPLIRNLMDTVQAIAFAFDYSAKRLLQFKENLETTDDNIKEDMGKRQKLKTLCETRWASRSDSLYTFLTAFSVVVDSLDDLQQDGDAKARSYHSSITKFDFIISLVAAQNVLQPLVRLSAILQTKDFDLIQAVTEAKVVVSVLQDKRDNDTEWDSIYDRAVAIGNSVEVVPAIPRGAARQQHRVNVPAANPSQYWKRALFLPFIDHLLQELRDRLIKNEDRFLAQHIVPSMIVGLTDDATNTIFDTFKSDFAETTIDDFKLEVRRWKARWNGVEETAKPTTLSETLKVTSYDLYPDLYKCMLILLCMPVTTATAERSFSVMRRVKTYLRSTMTTERLSALCVLHAYKECDIDIDKAIDCFALRKDRRLAFLFRIEDDADVADHN